jgi:hypothetical protein
MNERTRNVGTLLAVLVIAVTLVGVAIAASVKPAYEVGGTLSAGSLGLSTNDVVHGVFEVIGGTNLVYIDQSRAPNITNSVDVDTSS